MKVKREYTLKYWNAFQHCKRFALAWDYFIIGKGGYVQGWEDAKASSQTGDEIVEIEGNEGDHQLSDTTIRRWKKEIRDLPFKESLKTLLIHYNFDDIRVNEKDGIISFQGLARKKN